MEALTGASDKNPLIFGDNNLKNVLITVNSVDKYNDTVERGECSH